MSRESFSLSPFMRKLVLTVHIIVSVGLLGDSAGYLAVAIRGAAAADPTVAHASFEMLRMFAFVFGIPLSFAALLTGLLLGLGTGWGVFRYPWVTTKLLLILSVIAVGALVLDSGMSAMLTGSGGAEDNSSPARRTMSSLSWLLLCLQCSSPVDGGVLGEVSTSMRGEIILANPE